MNSKIEGSPGETKPIDNGHRGTSIMNANACVRKVAVVTVVLVAFMTVAGKAAVPGDERWSALGGGLGFDRQNYSPIWRSDLQFYVSKIAVLDTNVYAGGDMNLAFDSATSTSKTVRALVRWDGTAWANLGEAVPLSSGANCIGDAIVYDIAMGGGELYVTGEAEQYNCPFLCQAPFTDCVFVGLGRVPFLSRWDGTQWTDVGGGVVGGGAYANALALNGSDLYVAGSF